MAGWLSRCSPEVWVMMRPRQAFAKLPDPEGPWLSWRRPLLLLLVVSSSISLLTTGHLSLRLAASTATYWSFLPLIEILGLAAVYRAWPPGAVVDRFFMGHGPWLLYIIAFTAADTSSTGAIDTPAKFERWLALALATVVWSAWIDYRYFSRLGKLALHRAVSWSLFAVIMASSWIWSEITVGLGL